MKPKTQELMLAAWRAGKVIPAFNIPYLPIMKAVVCALRDTNTFGLVQVARPEWEKFEARSLRAVREEYERVKDERYTRLPEGLRRGGESAPEAVGGGGFGCDNQPSIAAAAGHRF